MLCWRLVRRHVYSVERRYFKLELSTAVEAAAL